MKYDIANRQGAMPKSGRSGSRLRQGARSTLQPAIQLLSAIAVLLALVCCVDLCVDCGELTFAAAEARRRDDGQDAAYHDPSRVKNDANLEEDSK